VTVRIINLKRAFMKDRVKLNLGCGDKFLSGYINVDMEDSHEIWGL
jgi:hypothetical protein